MFYRELGQDEGYRRKVIKPRIRLRPCYGATGYTDNADVFEFGVFTLPIRAIRVIRGSQF